MLLRDNLEHHARIRPRQVALSFEEVTVTYDDLLRQVRRLASALASLGVKRGDRVAILSQSTLSYVELLFAVTELGAVLVPLNHLAVGREHLAVLRDAEAGTLLFAGEFEETVSSLRPELPDPLHVLRIDRCGEAFPGLLGGGRVDVSPPPSRVPLSEADIALQIYTNGPSGRVRGAMLSHGNLMAAFASVALEIGLSPKDVYLSCSPLPFMGGVGRLLRFLYAGGRVVIRNEFDPETVLRTIERSRITHVLFTSAMMAQILDLPSADRFNLATLRKIIYSGNSIPLALVKRAIRFFGCDMVQSYGQVESSGVLTFLHPEDHSLDESAPYMRRLMSVGKEAIGVEIRVVNEEGSQVPCGQVGEVIARGKNIFAGYYRDPESTAEALRGGWLHTGDIASIDDEGYLYILDRKYDVISTGGIPVYPAEVEKIIAEHFSVAEAAVFPRPDVELGEIPVAVVALREGEKGDADSLLDHCRRNMAPFKIPRSFEFVPALPKNSAGKVLKAKLKEKLVRGGLTR